MDIFVIVNESNPTGTNLVLTEVIQPARYSYQEALDDLADIARDAGVQLDGDESSVFVPVKGTHLATDEYYVMALEVQDRG